MGSCHRSLEGIDATVSEHQNIQIRWTAMSGFAGIACTVSLSSILYSILNNLGGTMDNPGISPQSSESNGACSDSDRGLAQGRDLDAHRHPTTVMSTTCLQSDKCLHDVAKVSRACSSRNMLSMAIDA